MAEPVPVTQYVEFGLDWYTGQKSWGETILDYMEANLMMSGVGWAPALQIKAGRKLYGWWATSPSPSPQILTGLPASFRDRERDFFRKFGPSQAPPGLFHK
jgi:hypothetical protein